MHICLSYSWLWQQQYDGCTQAMITAQFQHANLQNTHILGPIEAGAVRHIQQGVVLVIVQASDS